MNSIIVGIDLDNTIITYDQVIHKIAVEKKWITEGRLSQNKKKIRDLIRQKEGGDQLWYDLQQQIYKDRILEAEMIPGVEPFIRKCRDEKLPIFIVSHKTSHLQMPAKKWLEANNFFAPGGLGFHPQDVFFEETRANKIRRIENLHCTHFIDDLEEVFLEAEFPSNISKIHFNSDVERSRVENSQDCKNWQEIYNYFFR